eukprot:GHVU01211198.1.p2 GENE.GHVU01211198.1~~GHVU01211198.1.p2  ORF type:complete len:104 (+),score=5.78 GHVU01211198.1:299-610(+)
MKHLKYISDLSRPGSIQEGSEGSCPEGARFILPGAATVFKRTKYNTYWMYYHHNVYYAQPHKRTPFPRSFFVKGFQVEVTFLPVFLTNAPFWIIDSIAYFAVG